MATTLTIRTEFNPPTRDDALDHIVGRDVNAIVTIDAGTLGVYSNGDSRQPAKVTDAKVVMGGRAGVITVELLDDESE